MALEGRPRKEARQSSPQGEAAAPGRARALNRRQDRGDGPASKKYGVIYADPEWRDEVWSRETGLDRATDNHYATSEAETIKARDDVVRLAAEHCVLFLWTTIQHDGIAPETMKTWGFEYKS